MYLNRGSSYLHQGVCVCVCVCVCVGGGGSVYLTNKCDVYFSRDNFHGGDLMVLFQRQL